MKNIAVLLSATLFVLSCSKGSEQAPQKDPSSQAQQQAKPVGIIELASQAVSLSEPLPARVEAVSIAQIRPQVSGIIQALSFSQGSYVEKGQQLYQIDPVKFELALKSAKASLENALAEAELAKVNKTRFESLLTTNAVSKQEYDAAIAQEAQTQAALSLAKANVESAEVNLAYTKVYAPIAGYIGPSSVTEGALVTAQQQTALAIVRKLDPVYVDITQSAVDATQLYPSLINSQIKEDDHSKTSISVRLLIGQNELEYDHEGELIATDLAVDENTGTISFRAIFPNPEGLLLPGTFVRAKIRDPNTSNSLLVPQKAVVIEPSGAKSVWTIDSNSQAAKRSIKAQTTYQNHWVVDSGLNAGDRVVVEGLMMLKEGMSVKPKIVSSALNKGSNNEGDASE